ncbi:Myb-like DNA-binding domain containing protein [Tritrichomonas foetus]|uniref:Myb-like DNA-binding domain containing protein n=1 Tax=Tritrichomonas foetus TaxID=1144522 RepID=A0A1J4JXW5_9EUKA|nr:Myb-like DNA-binding domain containing protein [Tritrichomonas foetus]|eukprot:OHT03835.1 Myb-like DNA-binding domain containing protein [Tritrichomonas foetus]
MSCINHFSHNIATNNTDVHCPSNTQIPLSNSPMISHSPKSKDIHKNEKENGRSKWTTEEDQILVDMVKKVGAKNWNQIASVLPNKTAKQCRDHYTNCLDPDIKSSLWTSQEEKILFQKYQEFGPKWSKIRLFLPGRTTSMIKNYFRMLSKESFRSTTNCNNVNYNTNYEFNSPFMIPNTPVLNQQHESMFSSLVRPIGINIEDNMNEPLPLPTNSHSIGRVPSIDKFFEISYLLNKPSLLCNNRMYV